MELAKTLIQKALGSNAAAALNNIRQSIEATPFGFLRHVDSQNLLTFIVEEHPQTIALIMSHLLPNFAAEILAGLPESRRLAVVRRIATMGRTNPEIIREVEKGLERRMSSVMSQSFERAGAIEAVAEMLNVADRATERSLLDSLTAEDPELVEEIRRALMQAGQKLSKHIRREVKANELEEKIRHIEQFGPILVEGLCRITKAPEARKKKAEEGLLKLLGRDARAAEKALDEAHAVLEAHKEKAAPAEEVQ